MKNLFRPLALLALLLVGFGQAKAYEVIIGTFDNGSVTANPSTGLAQGATVTLTISPNNGYVLDGLEIYRQTDSGNAEAPRRTAPTIIVGQGIEYEEVTAGSVYTISMPNDNVVVRATFAEAPEADDEPYVELSNDGKTLTFKYGKKPQDALGFSLSEWSTSTNKSTVTEVKFDQSFAGMTMYNLEQWFEGFTALETVNLVNLKTSEVTNFNRMFYNCSNLKTLIIDGTFIVTSTASIENMFYNVDHASTLRVQGSTSPSIAQDIFSYQVGSGTFYVFNSARLETENKFELSGIGWNEEFNLIEYKGGLFDTYNDYHRIEYTGWGFQVEWNPKYAIPGTLITLTCSTPGFTPKVTYFNDQDVSVRLTVTETEDGWTFEMPDALATISNVTFQAVLQLSQDQKTLTISAMDQDDAWDSGYPNITEYVQAQQMLDEASQPGNEQMQQGLQQYANLIDFITACQQNVETVVIDNTVSKVSRIDVSYLFNGFSKLTAISGLDNINMQRSSSTKKMFAGCSSLASLTIGSNFIIGSSDDNFTTTNMFAGCTALADGTLTVTAMPTINQNIFSGVFKEGTLVTTPEDLLGNEVTEENYLYLWKGGKFKIFNGNQQQQFATVDLSFAAGKKWITYYYTEDYDMALPEDVEAFYISGITMTDDMNMTGTINLVSTGTKLYSAVPTLIYRENFTSAGTYTATEVETAYANRQQIMNSKSDNFLGTATAKTFTDEEKSAGTYFVLRDGAFIWATPTTIAAHRCWIFIPGAQSASSLVFNIIEEGNTTGVNDVRSKMDDVRGEYYNLAGQRVAQPTKGIYISNGKKVIVK